MSESFIEILNENPNVMESVKKIQGEEHDAENASIEVGHPFVDFGFTMPSGYIYEQGMVLYQTQKEKVIIAKYHPIIIQELIDIETEESHMTVVYFKNGTKKTVNVPTELFANAMKLAEYLSKFQLVIISNVSKLFMKYIGDYININLLPEVLATNRYGWNDYGFMLPSGFITNNKGKNIVYSGEQIKGYSAKGTKGEWVKGVNHLRNFPIPLFLLGASAATPLLKVVGYKGYAILVDGVSGCGKSTALAFANSLWGNYQDTYINGSTTRNAFELLIAKRRGIPAMVDDLELGEAFKFLGDMMYAVSDGTTKARLNKNGELRAMKEMNTFLFIAGETKMMEHLKKGGEINRMLSITAPPFKGDQQVLNWCREFAQKQHGTVPYDWIEYITNKLDYQELNKKIEEYYQLNLPMKDDVKNIDNRPIAMFSFIQAVSDIFYNTFLELNIDIFPFTEVVLGNILQTYKDGDKAIEALELLKQQIGSNHLLVADSLIEVQDGKRYIGEYDKEVDRYKLFTTHVNQFLTEQGYQKGQVINRWMELGVLDKFERKGKEVPYNRNCYFNYFMKGEKKQQSAAYIINFDIETS